MYQIGDEIPKKLQDDYRRLKRAWDTRLIEIAIFESPNVTSGQHDDPISVSRRGSWYTISSPDGEEKVRGKEERDALVTKLRPQVSRAEGK